MTYSERSLKMVTFILTHSVLLLATTVLVLLLHSLVSEMSRTLNCTH